MSSGRPSSSRIDSTRTEPPVCYRPSWQLPGPDFHRQATTNSRNDTIDYLELIAAPLGSCWTHPTSAINFVASSSPTPAGHAAPFPSPRRPTQRRAAPVHRTSPDPGPPPSEGHSAPPHRLSGSTPVRGRLVASSFKKTARGGEWRQGHRRAPGSDHIARSPEGSDRHSSQCSWTQAFCFVLSVIPTLFP